MTEIREELALDSTMQGLIEKSSEIQGMCSDFIISDAHSKNIRFNEDMGLTFVAKEDSPQIHSFSMSRFSLGQLCAKLGVPVKYLEKCISEGRLELAQNNMNSWLSDYHKDIFIRTYGSSVRGVLSSKYAVCDTPDILKVLDDVLDLNQYQVKGSYLSEERLHLRLINKEKLPIANEDLFAGLFIDSSDVGRSTLTVNFCIYKQVCTNGLVVPKQFGNIFEQKHIGISSEEFHKGLLSSISRFDECAEKSIKMISNSIEAPSGLALNENKEDIINTVKNDVKISSEGAEKIVALMLTRYGNTLWGYINSITEVAQNYTLETRIGLETLAGSMLTFA